MSCEDGYLIKTDGLKRVDVAENNNKNMITSNAVYNGLSNKASTQVQNTNMAYLNSNSNKYLVITRAEGITVSYFRTMSFLIVDDTGTQICILSYGRRESDIAVLTNLAGTSYLTVKASNSDTVVLETSASWNKLYTIYGLTGYKPTIYASTTNPLA